MRYMTIVRSLSSMVAAVALSSARAAIDTDVCVAYTQTLAEIRNSLAQAPMPTNAATAMACVNWFMSNAKPTHGGLPRDNMVSGFATTPQPLYTNSPACGRILIGWAVPATISWQTVDAKGKVTASGSRRAEYGIAAGVPMVQYEAWEKTVAGGDMDFVKFNQFVAPPTIADRLPVSLHSDSEWELFWPTITRPEWRTALLAAYDNQGAEYQISDFSSNGGMK